MERGYDHVSWPTPRLIRRLGEIAWQEDNIPYGENRVRQLGHEAACLCFELTFRGDDMRQEPSPGNMPKIANRKSTAPSKWKKQGT